MPTDMYTKSILTVIACGLLALVVQNAMGPPDPPAAQSEAAPANIAWSNTGDSFQSRFFPQANQSRSFAPSNKQARELAKLYVCNSRDCIEISPCDRRHQPLSGDCADATGDRSTITPP